MSVCLVEITGVICLNSPKAIFCRLVLFVDLGGMGRNISFEVYG